MVAFSMLRSARGEVRAHAALLSSAMAVVSLWVSPVSAQGGTEAVGMEASTAETSPAANVEVSSEGDSTEIVMVEEEQKPSPYYNKVLGKLRIEAFIGPSRYNPNKFDGGLTTGGVKGPEFGASIMGGRSEGTSMVGAVYRQANYDVLKLMKVGLETQWAFRTPYVHPLIRLGFGYARAFDAAFPFPQNGLFFTLGAGIRVPIVRWLSFAGTFDWSLISLFGTTDSGNTGVAAGSQIGGTFALTVHLIGVDKN